MTNLNIEGVKVGTVFANRDEIKDAGLHRHGSQGGAGISFSTETGLAESIVLNGGYEDDEDHGSLIYYTGQGGNENGRQVKDQEFLRGNRALWISRDRHEKVRIIRGHKLESKWAPDSGYRYDGLYYVTNAWQKRGKSNHLIYLFQLEGAPGEFSYPGMKPSPEETDNENGNENGNPTTKRKEYTGSRIIRDTKISKEIKELYNGKCQACSLTLPLPSGVNYAEAAHLHPLGKPFEGPDSKANILCLCPNCHVRLDYGAFYIDDELNVQPDNRPLNVHEEHQIDKKSTRFHKKHIYLKK